MARNWFLIRTKAIARKEFMHILRDRQQLLFALGMPVFLLFILGYAVSFDLENIPLVVVDQEQSAASRQLVQTFTAGKLFQEVAKRERASGVETLFRSWSAKAALVIPRGFDRDLRRNDEAVAQLLLDGTDNNTAAVALGYANALALQFATKTLFAGGLISELPLQVHIRTLYNPALRSSVFLVPGLIAIILVIIGVMLTSLTIAREYERGSMEQLFTTPVGRLEIIFGKLGPYFLVGVLQILVVLVAGVGVFKVPVHGSIPLLFFVSAIFLLAMLMQGLVISVIARNQMVASQMAVVSTLLPSMLLSGFVFPINTMPLPLRFIAAIFPARYFIHALRGILLRGNGFDVVAGDCLAMAAFFLVLLGIATHRFVRTLE